MSEKTTFRFLFELPAYQVSRMPQDRAVRHWRKGQLSGWSSMQLEHYRIQIALRLLEQGLLPRGRVAIVADTFSKEWMALDMAIMSAGGISCPVHYPMQEEEMVRLFVRLQPAIVVRTKGVQMPVLNQNIPILILEEWMQEIEVSPKRDVTPLDLVEVRSTDIATIIQTSGSNGEMRGVCLTHRNLVSNVMSTLSLVPFQPGTRVMSFLPLSHIFERAVCYVYLACGANIYFLDSYRYAVFALKDIRPAYFSSVPLILERFAHVLESRIEEMGWFTRWAYRSWERTDRNWLAHAGSFIAHQWIIKRWKHRMGGKLRGILCGAAYLDPQVEKLYDRSGIMIRQGYGLSEASPAVSVNRFEPGGHRRGSVGLPLPGVDVEIAEDGEILVKGPNVMAGYDGDETATQLAIREGWLYTGDIGHLDEDGFLWLTGRKSDIYKHASGKYISPARIESVLTMNPLIRQAVIIGYKRPYSVALICPDFDLLEKVCRDKNIHWTAPAYMVHNPLVMEIFKEILSSVPLEQHERIEKFILVAEEWTAENGLLTPTLKVRRKFIEERYAKDVEDMYA